MRLQRGSVGIEGVAASSLTGHGRQCRTQQRAPERGPGMVHVDEPLQHPTEPRRPLRSSFQPPPLIAGRRGRRNTYVEPSRNRASEGELAELLSADRSRQLWAIAATARATVRWCGHEVTAPLRMIDKIPTCELLPVRRPASYPTQRNFVSKEVVAAPDGDRAVWSESFNERAHLRELGWEGVHDLNTQALMLTWQLPTGRIVSHFPDIIARDDMWTTTLYDISAQAFMNEHRRTIFDLTACTCAQAGWSYEVGVDSISKARELNLRFLYGFRNYPGDLPPRDWSDASAARTVAGLVWAEGGGTVGWTRTCARLWRRDVGFDMDRPLDDCTVLQLQPPGPPRVKWSVVAA